MKRKIIQIANSTQLVSLPRKWCLSNNLKKGDEIDVEEQGDQVIICPEKKKVMTSVEIDISDLDRTSILYFIRALYKKGYDEIKLIFNNPVTEHFRKNKTLNIITLVHEEATRLLGMEVIQQKENFCLLKAISDTYSSDFNIILKRIFGLFLDAYSDFVEGLKNNNRTQLETIKEKHDTITKFISHCQRLLNKNVSINKNNYFLPHILTQLDTLIDILNFSARNFIGYNKKVSKPTADCLGNIAESFFIVDKLFYKFDKKLIIEISRIKANINKKILKIGPTLSYQELTLLSTMQGSLKIFQCLTENFFAMHH